MQKWLPLNYSFVPIQNSLTIQSIVGTKVRRVFKTLPNIPGDITERTVEGILTAPETYCAPRKNTTYEQ